MERLSGLAIHAEHRLPLTQPVIFDEPGFVSACATKAQAIGQEYLAVKCESSRRNDDGVAEARARGGNPYVLCGSRSGRNIVRQSPSGHAAISDDENERQKCSRGLSHNSHKYPAIEDREAEHRAATGHEQYHYNMVDDKIC
jgi:hypothetical protein